MTVGIDIFVVIVVLVVVMEVISVVMLLNYLEDYIRTHRKYQGKKF